MMYEHPFNEYDDSSHDEVFSKKKTLINLFFINRCLK